VWLKEQQKLKAFANSNAHRRGELIENWRKVHNGYLQKAVSCVKYKEPTSYRETTQYTKTIMKGTSMICRTLHNK
jgi:hypothetical protein